MRACMVCRVQVVQLNAFVMFFYTSSVLDHIFNRQSIVFRKMLAVSSWVFTPSGIHSPIWWTASDACCPVLDNMVRVTALSMVLDSPNTVPVPPNNVSFHSLRRREHCGRGGNFTCQCTLVVSTDFAIFWQVWTAGAKCVSCDLVVLVTTQILFTNTILLLILVEFPNHIVVLAIKSILVPFGPSGMHVKFLCTMHKGTFESIFSLQPEAMMETSKSSGLKAVATHVDRTVTGDVSYVATFAWSTREAALCPVQICHFPSKPESSFNPLQHISLCCWGELDHEHHGTEYDAQTADTAMLWAPARFVVHAGSRTILVLQSTSFMKTSIC